MYCLQNKMSNTYIPPDPRLVDDSGDKKCGTRMHYF